MTLSQILNDAAAMVEQRGLHQGDFIPNDAATEGDADTCPVCVLAAINVAAGRAPDDPYEGPDSSEVCDAAGMLRLHLGRTEPGHVVEVIGAWNDDDNRTGSDVITALRATAAWCREGGL